VPRDRLTGFGRWPLATSHRQVACAGTLVGSVAMFNIVGRELMVEGYPARRDRPFSPDVGRRSEWVRAAVAALVRIDGRAGFEHNGSFAGM
jgi:hypothetical protein